MKATTIIFTALLAVASVGAAAIPRPAADSVPGDEIAKPGLCAIPEGCGKAVARIGQGGHQKREDEDESKEEEVVVHDAIHVTREALAQPEPVPSARENICGRPGEGCHIKRKAEPDPSPEAEAEAPVCGRPGRGCHA